MKNVKNILLLIVLSFIFFVYISCQAESEPGASTEIIMTNNSSYDLIVALEISFHPFVERIKSYKPREFLRGQSDYFYHLSPLEIDYHDPNSGRVFIKFSNMADGEVMKLPAASCGVS